MTEDRLPPTSPHRRFRIDPSEDGVAGMIRRRDFFLAAPPLEDNDMLEEILLRLPPKPSSLPRASAVCKRWRGILTDPGFLRRFREHHLEPPLLGVYQFQYRDQVEFTPTLAAPDRIPPQRFDLRIRDVDSRSHFGPQSQLLGCRHGRVLVLHRIRGEVLVCDPITGDRRPVPIPPEFKRGFVKGTVLCAARDKGHVHNNCNSAPFKVVLLLIRTKDYPLLASVYSSETDAWGDFISTMIFPDHFEGYPSTLVGNVLYWPFMYEKDGILEFDMDTQNLNVIEGPPGMKLPHDYQIIQVEDGALGVAMLSRCYHDIQMWQREVDCHGVATWVLSKTIEMHNFPGLPPQAQGEEAWVKFIAGHVEDTDGILLYVKGYIYIVQLKSMQSRRLFWTRCVTHYHSFKSFYAPGARKSS